ncbi:unnamed protein product, partial [Scytosiphon promiscuus]
MNATRRRRRGRPVAWEVHKILTSCSVMTLLTSCGPLLRSPTADAHAAAKAAKAAAGAASGRTSTRPAFVPQSTRGCPRTRGFVPQWHGWKTTAKAATTAVCIPARASPNEGRAPSYAPMSMSSSSVDGGQDRDGLGPTAGSDPPPKRRVGRPRGVPNKRRRRRETSKRDMGADELRRLVQLAQGGGDVGDDGVGGEDGKDEDGSYGGGGGGGSRGGNGIQTGPERPGLRGDDPADDVAGGDVADSNGTSDGQRTRRGRGGDGEFGDLEGGVDFDAEIREVEKQLRELRSQQQRRLDYEQREAEVDDEIGLEAAKMEAAMDAIFGPGKRPSDLLRSAKQRQRMETSEGSKAGLSRRGGGLEEDVEEGREESFGGEVENEQWASVSSELDAEGGAAGAEGYPEELPDALFLMDRLDELLALESDGLEAGLPHPEEEQDDETARLTQMSEDDQLLNPSLRQVLVVLGKHLIRDQVTVEYASRIRRLVQGLKSGRLQPDLICFTGGTVRDNRVADASAGYIFFRHLCEQHEIDTENVGFLVESESTCTKEAMQNVVKEVSR